MVPRGRREPGQLCHSGRMKLRNPLIASLAIAGAGALAFLARSKRPQLPEPAAEPPRLGYSRNGSAPTS
ncbi:hypothetical protein FEK33_01570 [Nocardia asteroides NBRC 15531]|nr:hypothetical protein FEK33_01570 [Nocardia asteroides NBRC 15531]SFL62517.1 hypothetical protein SAMN05444423_101318 [Nocardia asteroides]VEG32064.1 Uncharacterised protein [Nocardia asteroides]